MAGKDKGSNSRKRKGGAPEETVGKKRKTETKISKQAKKMKAASKKDKGKNQAKVGRQKNKAKAQTTISKKGNTQPTVSKQKNGATPRTTVSKKGKTQGTASKQKNEETKTTQAKTAKEEKKAEGTKKVPAKAAEPAKKDEFVLKAGVPKDDELEALGMEIGDKWVNLGRRLNIEEPKLQAIGKDFDSLHERGFQMLKHWKQKQGSGASYKSLADALKHKLVGRKDLAEKFCFKRLYSRI